MATRRELEQTSFLYGGNSSFIEELYGRYLTDPAAVDPSWRAYFDELEPENRALFERARAALEPQAAASCGWSPANLNVGAGGRDRRSRRQGADPRPSARDHADPRLSRARPPDRQARSAGPHRTTSSIPSSTTTPTASPTPTSTASSTSTTCWAWRRPRCARSWRSCSKTYSGTVGIEFMHIQEPEQKSLDPGADRGHRRAVRHHGRGEARDPRAAHRDRGLRAVPARQVPGHQALRPRRRREHHPGAGDDHPHRRRARRRGDRASACRIAAGSTCWPT